MSELKEQVFRTKARLQLLKETVLGGVIGASRAVIRHRNEMGATFRLVKVVYALDGVQIFSKADDTGGCRRCRSSTSTTAPSSPARTP